MSVSVLILVILALSLIGYWLGRRRALAQEQSARTGRLQTLPRYYGYYVALWCGLPALALLLVWLLAQAPVWAGGFATRSGSMPKAGTWT